MRLGGTVIKTIGFVFVFVFLCGFTLEKVAVENVSFGTPPRILTVGDSVTLGEGDSVILGGTEYDDISGYRDNLQNKLGIYQFEFVGQWGNVVGSSSTVGPETQNDDNNYRLIGYYNPRHCGWGGGTTEDVLPYITTSGQVAMWFDEQNAKNTIIIYIGQNDQAFAGKTQTAVDNIEDFIDHVVEVDDTINIIVCNSGPNTNVGMNARVTTFNGLLETMVSAYEKDNLYFCDLASVLQPCYLSTCYDDWIHPNAQGYEIIAAAIYSVMVENELN